MEFLVFAIDATAFRRRVLTHIDRKWLRSESLQDKQHSSTEKGKKHVDYQHSQRRSDLEVRGEVGKRPSAEHICEQLRLQLVLPGERQLPDLQEAASGPERRVRRHGP